MPSGIHPNFCFTKNSLYAGSVQQHCTGFGQGVVLSPMSGPLEDIVRLRRGKSMIFTKVPHIRGYRDKQERGVDLYLLQARKGQSCFQY